MSEDLQKCPSCESPYGYESGEGQYTCPECSFEWNLADVAASDELVVLDANGAREIPRNTKLALARQLVADIAQRLATAHS